MLESLFSKVAGLRACNIIKKGLQHWCFPVSIGKHLYRRTLQTAASEKAMYAYFHQRKTLSPISRSFLMKFYMRNYGIRTSTPEQNCLPVKVRVWFRVRDRIRVGVQYFSGGIILEPKLHENLFFIAFDGTSISLSLGVTEMSLPTYSNIAFI